MASDAYLLIDGINGESQAQGMTNNIELDSFSFGASNPADVGGKGLSAGKCSLSDFNRTTMLLKWLRSSASRLHNTCSPRRPNLRR